jgi:ABC-type branched-subunit amino acid transport system ATPase component
MSSSDAAALSVRNLFAGYGPTVVLEDVSFSLPEKGALALLGRNGVGKTTLLASIMGHTTFHAGAIAFKSKAIEKMEVHERSRLGIGYVPQTRDVFQSLTVEENSRWQRVRVNGRPSEYMSCSLAWPNVAATWVINYRVASNKCCQLAVP